MRICIDPGHGMANKKGGVYDPGACSGRHEEAAIAMTWANELRAILMDRGHYVIRTRVDHKDPDPIGFRARIAKDASCDIMISLHCNAAAGTAHGTETFYRGEENRLMATRINNALVKALNSRDRGVKTEAQSQHATLAVMAFQPCFLIELGFIDNPDDQKRMLDPLLRKNACEALADVILGSAPTTRISKTSAA